MVHLTGLLGASVFQNVCSIAELLRLVGIWSSRSKSLITLLNDQIPKHLIHIFLLKPRALHDLPQEQIFLFHFLLLCTGYNRYFWKYLETDLDD